MGGLSIWHWIIVGGVVFVLFGGKFKISDVMTDVAKGIKAFKKGMAEDETTASTPEEAPKSVEESVTGPRGPRQGGRRQEAVRLDVSPRPSRRLPATLARIVQCSISTSAS